MSKAYPVGAHVAWNWASGTGEGEVKEVFERRVTRTIKGSKIVRNGSEEEPAYLIVQSDGDKVLKLHSELRKHA